MSATNSYTRQDAQKQIDALHDYLMKIEERIKQRYFSDPVAWKIFDALDSDSYTRIFELASYCLACEILQKEPISPKKFDDLNYNEREALLEHAYQVILPGEAMP